jgi:hypothetical protein
MTYLHLACAVAAHSHIHASMIHDERYAWLYFLARADVKYCD